MKKHQMIVATLLLLAVTLTGCACEHQWTEADCMNPQICTKCEEIGTDALGHDWSAATCTAPQICTRCGEAQGAALGHSFGDWSFGENDMTRTCAFCDSVESEELDRALYLDTLLPGWWEFCGMYYADAYYSAYQVPVPGDKLLFSQGYSFTGMVNQEAFAGSWEFLEYGKKDEKELYYFSANAEDERSLQMLFQRTAEEDLLYIFFAEGAQVILSRNDAVASGIVGSWGAEAGTDMYSLTFHEDHTVTGNLDGEFTGTWQLLPLEEPADMEDFIADARYCGLYIRYDRGGEEVILKATVRPSEENMYETRTENFIPGQLILRYNDSGISFQPMSPEEISNKQGAIQEGPTSILGTWSSLYLKTFSSDPNTTPDDKTLLDYSITFKSDNTFTAFFGKERTGIWSYASDLSNADNPEYGSYCYYLKFDDENNAYRSVLYYRNGQMPMLQCSVSDGTLFLGMLSDRDDEIIHSVVGSWTSVYDEVNDHTTGEKSRTSTMEYHFTIQEDGTYTGYDGSNVSGTWHLQNIDYGSDGSHIYYFALYDTNSKQTNHIIIYDHGDSENRVDYRVTTKDYQRWITLKQFTQEDLDAAKLGPKLPIGEWVSTEVTHYGGESGADERIETDAYSFVIFEDGTFTAQLGTTIHGTWSFREYRPDSSYEYYFDYPGKPENSSPFFYVSKENDFLSVRIVLSGQESFYAMERK